MPSYFCFPKRYLFVGESCERCVHGIHSWISNHWKKTTIHNGRGISKTHSSTIIYGMAYMKVPPLKKKLETLKYDPNPLKTKK